MKRSEQRETIFRLLFMKQFNSAEEMPEQQAIYMDSLKSGLEEVSYAEKVTPEDEAYIKEKLANITAKTPEIDELLNKTSRGWKTSRMSKVDLSILRLAAYEILYDEDVPVRVAINEAVEISKQYGGDASASFVNGILGQIARSKDTVTETSEE
ncbi:MAG: transcription antitermination factor NusB [Eubacterium sp.]|nr:transcription antitermination factor NusB [Eubacterium sp.]